MADIRSVLHANDPDNTLRQRLNDLEQQLEGQVAQLQQQRQRVQALLAEGATLRDVDRPKVQSSLTYQLLADVLKGYAAGSSADVRALDQALLSRLDMFNWGEEYRTYWLQLAHSLADSVDIFQDIGERIVAAGRLASHDPQLEEIADEVARQLQAIREFIGLPQMERPLQNVFNQPEDQMVRRCGSKNVILSSAYGGGGAAGQRHSLAHHRFKSGWSNLFAQDRFFFVAGLTIGAQSHQVKIKYGWESSSLEFVFQSTGAGNDKIVVNSAQARWKKTRCMT